MNMSIDDMSTETIEKYLEKRREDESFPKIVKGKGRDFKIDKTGKIDIKDKCLNSFVIDIFDSLNALYEAVEISKKQRGLQ